MSIQKTTFNVDGMTCPACEARISGVLENLEGVMSSDVRLQGGTVTVEFDDGLIGLGAVKAAVEKAGYAVRGKKGPGTALSLGIGLLLVAAYLAAGSTGIFASLPKVDASIGYAMLFVIGLLTSIHCIAMCGGIALSQSLRSSGTESRNGAVKTPLRAKQLVPGILYNAGRIVSYTVIGGIVGAIGAAFSFSPLVKGVIAGIAGAFMVVLGLRMIGLMKDLPLIPNFVPSQFRLAAAKITSGLRKGGPFAVGILNGLMPCGPLQTMQLYALGTGSAAAGALSMFIFSAGTVPLMLLFGVSAALLPRKFVPVMVKASAVLVMFLGVITFARAAGLAGIALPFGPSAVVLQNPENSANPAQNTGLARATVTDGVQSIVTEFTASEYLPFEVQAGVPLKWTIRIREEDINGCNNRVIVPEYGLEKALVPGDNLIEFTPKKEGTISYSCWMGMIRSRITVVGDIGGPGAAIQSPAANPPAIPGSAGAGGGGCCGS